MSIKLYDYLIVGAGLFGSICAYELNKIGKKCLVIDKRNHIGGNCYTKKIDDINVHNYGAHIFHTSNTEVWNYINQFACFNQYRHHLKVSHNGKIYSFPINLFTLHQLYGITTPYEAIKKLEEVKIKKQISSNLEEWGLSLVGQEIYDIFIKGYTKKQWGRDPKELPISIIKRIPIRVIYDDCYFNDEYQGIPIDGYTKIFRKLLKNIDINLNTDYFSNREYFDNVANRIIYTGSIDKFYNYKFGRLDYRSSQFSHQKIEMKDFQGVSVMNYTDENVSFTRIIEHKHFEFGEQENTVITKEYSIEGNGINDFYYPINDEKNNHIFNMYKDLTKREKCVTINGRIGNYAYNDMDKTIQNALELVDKEIHERI